MKKTILAGAFAVLLAGSMAVAQTVPPPACTMARPDISNTCLTTPVDMCVDAVYETVTVQLGGPGAEDSNGSPGNYTGTCVGTAATALITFEKLPGNQVAITIDNRTCDDAASLTSLCYNITQSVTSYTASSLNVLSGTQDETWHDDYSQTTSRNDGLGFKCDGFGYFDAVLYDGNGLAGNGGQKNDIRAGEVFQFVMDVQPGFNLCDFLSEISTPPPGSRNRNAAAHFKACGPAEANSAFIGPCNFDDVLFALVDDVRLMPSDNAMRVEWSTSLEIRNAGFNVLRREAMGGEWERINPGLIQGTGDTVTGARYSFVDETAVNGVEYVYQIEDIDYDGKIDLSDRRVDVANPIAPQIKLAAPAYGATIDLDARPGFSFANNGARSHLVIQLASDPTFSGHEIAVSPVSGRIGSSEVELTRQATLMTDLLAKRNGSTVYWRLADRTGAPLSDTFRVEVLPRAQDGHGNTFRPRRAGR